MAMRITCLAHGYKLQLPWRADLNRRPHGWESRVLSTEPWRLFWVKNRTKYIMLSVIIATFVREKGSDYVLGVYGTVRGWGLKSLARIFSPALARKSSGFARILLFSVARKWQFEKFCSSTPPPPPPPRLVRQWLYVVIFHNNILKDGNHDYSFQIFLSQLSQHYVTESHWTFPVNDVMTKICVIIVISCPIDASLSPRSAFPMFLPE